MDTLPGLDAATPQSNLRRRMWLDNGLRTVRIVGRNRAGNYIVEWCKSGKWRKLSTPVKPDALGELHFAEMPIASLAPMVDVEPAKKFRKTRRKR